ncbi:sensor histidine kinase [Dactylosporangium salmoneum]
MGDGYTAWLSRRARGLFALAAVAVSLPMLLWAPAAGGAAGRAAAVVCIAVFDADPQRAREAVRRTEAAGRAALEELRSFLRTVREGDDRTVREGDDGDDRGARQDGGPQPTLDDLDRLAETVRAAGLEVDLDREGGGEVPLGVQLSAYRIVQETLTNALRHARAGRARVVVRISAAAVDVLVRDDGRGGVVSGGGHGIAGMRERAGLLGGTLRAEGLAGGGFEVEARLPYGERA